MAFWSPTSNSGDTNNMVNGGHLHPTFRKFKSISNKSMTLGHGICVKILS